VTSTTYVIRLKLVKKDKKPKAKNKGGGKKMFK